MSVVQEYGIEPYINARYNLYKQVWHDLDYWRNSWL